MGKLIISTHITVDTTLVTGLPRSCSSAHR
jgi:hypothetical protein